MTAEFWAILGVGVGGTVTLVWTIEEGRQRIERKIDRLIEEVRYPNREAQKRDMMGAEAYDAMNEML